MTGTIYESFDRLTESCISSQLEYESKCEKICERFFNTCDSSMAQLKELLEKAEAEAKEKAKAKKTTRPRGRTKKNQTLLTESADSPHVELNSTAAITSSSKPKRMASQVASSMISQCAHLSNDKHLKLRRPSGQSEDLLAKFKLKAVEEIDIKIEKEERDIQIANDLEENAKKNENIMPPPAVPEKSKKIKPQRKIKKEIDSSDTDSDYPSTRSTRSKKVTNKTTENQPIRSSRRKKKGDSDVIVLPETPAHIIEVLDSSVESTDINTTQESNKDQTPEKSKVVDSLTNKDDRKNKENEIPKDTTEVIKDKNEDKKRPKRFSYSSDEDIRAKKRTKKGTKTKQPKKQPFVSLENIKIEKSIYEDALSVPKDIVVIPSTSKILDKTYQLQNETISKPMNETFVTANTLNSTYCTVNMNATVTIDKTTKNAPIVENIKVNAETLRTCSIVLNQNDAETKKNEPQLRITLQKSPMIEKLIEEKIQTPPIEINKETIPWQKPEKPIEPPLLTDDESDISPQKQETPKQISTQSDSSTEKIKKGSKQIKKGIKTKPIFSPYANSPVRKRVAAFEKLESAEKIPQQTTRITRTKTKKLIEENEKKSKIPPPKPKYNTPMGNNKLKLLKPSTDIKTSRMIPQSATKTNTSTISNSSDILQKAQTAIKLTRADLLEKHFPEKKEDDAKKKKEALLKAKIEESKRLREEKMMKAQKVREEKDRQKDEKLRQVLAEKEEKQREELEKKKAYLSKKAADLDEQRKVVESNKLQRKKEEEEEERRQQYRKYREDGEKKYKKATPALPTPDCYDSDSSDSSTRPKVTIQEWAHKRNFLPVLEYQSSLSKSVINKLFSVKPITPDLEEIFENIPKAYLKRNSSAVWRTPPRYSMLPK